MPFRFLCSIFFLSGFFCPVFSDGYFFFLNGERKKIKKKYRLAQKILSCFVINCLGPCLPSHCLPSHVSPLMSLLSRLSPLLSSPLLSCLLSCLLPCVVLFMNEIFMLRVT